MSGRINLTAITLVFSLIFAGCIGEPINGNEGEKDDMEPEIPIHVLSENLTFMLQQVRLVDVLVTQGGFNCYTLHTEDRVRLLGGQIDFTWVPESATTETLFVSFWQNRHIDNAHGQSPLRLEFGVDQWMTMKNPGDVFEIFAVLGQDAGVAREQQIDVEIRIEYQSMTPFETERDACPFIAV